MVFLQMIWDALRQDNRRIWWIFSLCIVWLWTIPTYAYVLKGPHILDLMLAELAGAQTLQVDQIVMVEDPVISSQPIELQETLSFIFPDRFRSDVQFKETHRIQVLSKGRAIRVVDGTIVGDSEGRFDRYKDIFLYNSRKLLQKILFIHGVDVGITSLGRMEDRIVFVIGADYPDDTVSQLWVDKERLLPLRWINVIPAENGREVSERFDFIYRNWQKVDGIWYPLQIETFHNQTPIRQIRVTKVQANGVISAELLDIPHLETIYQQKEEPLTENGPPTANEMEEVQRTLDDFRKKFDP